MKTIVLTGGGSGGHIAPILAVAPELLKTKKLYWIGSSRFEKDAATELNIQFKKIHSGKLRRYFSVKNIIDIFHVKIGFFQSLIFLIKTKSKLVFSTGGFVSVPVVAAAWILRIPIIIHEQTIGFGLANKIGAFCASKILLAFKNSKKYIPKKYHHKIEIVGNPIRADLIGGNLDGLQKFLNDDLNKNKPILYITGGGQGAKIINDVIFDSLGTLAEKYYVIHQAGKSGIAEAEKMKTSIRANASFKDYFPFEFIGKELADIYASADIVIARSGAGTVNELDYFGIQSIFVPLQPVQNDEQMKNAEWFLFGNNGKIIKQDSLSKDVLINSLNSLKKYEFRRYRNTSNKENIATQKILDFLTI